MLCGNYLLYHADCVARKISKRTHHNGFLWYFIFFRNKDVRSTTWVSMEKHISLGIKPSEPGVSKLWLVDQIWSAPVPVLHSSLECFLHFEMGTF